MQSHAHAFSVPALPIQYSEDCLNPKLNFVRWLWKKSLPEWINSSTSTHKYTERIHRPTIDGSLDDIASFQISTRDSSIWFSVRSGVRKKILFVIWWFLYHSVNRRPKRTLYSVMPNQAVLDHGQLPPTYQLLNNFARALSDLTLQRSIFLWHDSAWGEQPFHVR